MPAEYSRNSKNISRDKWKREMSMKEIILRDAKMCAYAAGNVEHFKYLMKRLGYVFKKDVWMEVEMLAESTAEMVVESNISVTGMKSDNNQNEIGRQKKPTDGIRKQPTDLDSIAIPEIHNSSDVNVAEMDKSITDVTGKSEFVEIRETEPVNKVGRIVRRISELGGYENISDSVKADIFGFDIADISGSIGLFSDVMKKFGIKLDGMSFMRSFRGFMMRVLIEMSVKIKQKIRCGIGAEGGESSAQY